MKRPPSKPFELKDRAVLLLCEGVLEGKPYQRLDALQATLKAEQPLPADWKRVEL